MKTAEEILFEKEVAYDYGKGELYHSDQCIEAMKEYENQFKSKSIELESIKTKINSTILCLSAHPDNEPDSEFADRISDLEEILNDLNK